MHTVTVEYAKTHLTELLEEVAAGEDVVIEQNHQPLARLVAEPISATGTPPPNATGGWPFLGLYVGKMTLPEGWDKDLPLDMWDSLKS